MSRWFETVDEANAEIRRLDRELLGALRQSKEQQSHDQAALEQIKTLLSAGERNLLAVAHAYGVLAKTVESYLAGPDAEGLCKLTLALDSVRGFACNHASEWGDPCPACGERALAWGPTVGLWACGVCKKSFRPGEVSKPETCQHTWQEEYYGTRCPRCNTFYPHGCAPWDAA